jgi:hypothetical protein
MNTIKNLNWEQIIYNSGDFFFPKFIKNILDKNIYITQNNSFYINGWSLLHCFSGIILGVVYLYLDKGLNFYYYYLFIIHTIWELWQMLIGMSKPWKLTGDSNLIDTFVDTIFFMIGTYITLKLYYTI